VRRLRIVLVITACMLAVPGVAGASWTGNGTGDALSKADTAPTGNRATVSVSGRNVALTWAASSFSGGTNVAAYRIKRYAAVTGTPATVKSGCAGDLTTLSCTENAVPVGAWYYTVTPVQHNWTGPESPASVNAVVAAPSLTLTGSTFLTSLPGSLPGTIASFVTGETVTWRLDNPTTGPSLTGSIVPNPVNGTGTATTSVTIPNGTADGTHTVYAIGSSGASTASATFTVDTQPPVVGAAVIQKAAGGAVGSLRQAATYRVYATVTDAGSPITSVTANVSTVTTGSTTVPLTAGSYPIGGVTYTYRSAVLTSNNPLTAGTKTFSITATDSYSHTATTGGFSVVIDNTKPSASSLATTNKVGGTVGLAETGDSITFTYTEPMDPASILTGWDGTSATPVTLQLLNANGQGGDRVQIWDATNTTQLPLGTVRLGATGYTATTILFSNSSMTVTGSTTTVVLGTPNAAGGTAVVSSNTKWTPTNTATDLAGNACQNTAVNEPVSGTPEF
jgi:hypothetical protein